MILKELCSGLCYPPSQNYLNLIISLFCLVSLSSLQQWEVCLEGSVPASSSHITSRSAEKFKCTDEPRAVQEVSNPSATPCAPTAHFSRSSTGTGTSANYSTSSILQKQQGLAWKPARAASSAPQLQKFLLRGSRGGHSAGGRWADACAWGAAGLQSGNASARKKLIRLSGLLSSLFLLLFFLFIFSSPCLFFASFIYSFLISFSTSSLSPYFLPSFLLFFYLFVCLLAFWCPTTRCTICYIVIQK